MSARLDTVANYIPARITAFLMVVSAKILGADWKNSLNILQRDHDKTFSPNAGYPMATMAGALRVRLEKIGHYTLGDNQEPVTLKKCKKAISIMKLTTLLFCIVVVCPSNVSSYIWPAGGGLCLASLKPILSVLAFLTILPVGKQNHDIYYIAKNMYMFPVAGLVIGSIIGAMAFGISNFLHPLLVGFLIAGALIIITGVHHTDALSRFR